ncbi:di-heme oxidoredictase family protein [Algihabitans sp.]|uniref:di-heme oxidoreductase family protein n=1 Tax=Algihabitans sp. TaxID=2821514 RepID=UPI003BABC3C7
MKPLAFVAFLSAVAFGAVAVFAAPGERSLDHRDDLTAEERTRVLGVLALPDDFSKAEAFERWPGGGGTSRKLINRDAFSHPLETLTFEEEQLFRVGNGIFRKLWVSSPASTQASDGLGPLFNARSCQRCHLKDGRGHPPAEGETAISMFLRLSIPPQNEAQRQLLESGQVGVIPDPVYGGQLQNFAVPGHLAEGQMTITYEEVPVELNGGETVSLRKPVYGIADLGYGPTHPELMVSPRVASQVIGLGLLEAIHEGDILAQADPDDADGDGISGRPNWVRDDTTGELVLGRFGWKAGNPNVRQQSAHAFTGDIGISTSFTPYHAGECTEAQTACQAAPTGVQVALGDVEAPDTVLDLVTFYTETLAPPARRDLEEPEVLRGKELFHASGCAACHTPKYVTRRDAAIGGTSFQLIWPYTDLLLHDMGEGLADGRPEWQATGREWRTAPLWGIGLTETVNGHTFFLHDGRARNLLEAILWHGGEAQAARDAVVAMTPEERDDLLAFIGSL